MDVCCIHRRIPDDCVPCAVVAALLEEQICVECGDDIACEGHTLCSDCLLMLDRSTGYEPH